MRRLGMVASLAAGVLLTVQACERTPLEPGEAAAVVRSTARRADLDPAVDIATLLDSLAVGGVYTVEPKGGYSSLRYTAMPERAVYANPIRGHPTGIELPAGLPVRVLAEGAMVSRPTPAFTAGYCLRLGSWDSRCAVPWYTYTIHGLAPGFDVTSPYEFGTGLQVQWSRLGVRYAASYNRPDFYAGAVLASGLDIAGELHFRRSAGCCYYQPFGDSVYSAWETYEGRWRFGAVLNDGGRAEYGEPPLLTLSGPRTDQPMTDSATFTLTAAGGGTLSEVRWWFIQPASNTFDGEPLPYVPEPSSGLMVPRYPDGQRTVITTLSRCATQTTCRYQAGQPGAVVATARMPNGDLLGARNLGRSGGHVRIAADTATLAQGDTTVFRVTAPGAMQWSVTGYSFRPVGAVAASAVQAVRGPVALRMASLAVMSSERVRVARGRTTAHFRDAALKCSEATVELCYDDPPVTGYEIVTAVVDGEAQRDSVMVTVVPVLRVSCTPSPVVRTAIVSCTAAMSDSSTFTPTRRYAEADGKVLVDEELPAGMAVSSYPWTGKAIVATEVEISALHGQHPVSGRGAFNVVARTGPEWTGLSIQATTPTPEFVAGDPLPEVPFLTEGSWLTQDGALGQYHRGMITPWGMTVEGPNSNLVYTRGSSVVEPPRIFVHAWLQRGSAFYNAQRGGANVIGVRPCSGADVDRVRSAVIEHEGLHHEADVRFFEAHDVQKLLESARVRFDVRQLGDSAALSTAQIAARDTAYGIAWAASVVAAVHREHLVNTPSCRRQ